MAAFTIKAFFVKLVALYLKSNRIFTEKRTMLPANKWQLISLAMELGFIIALPLVAFAFLGKWIDSQMNSEPWFTLAGILIAIVSTTFWMVKKVKTLIK